MDYGLKLFIVYYKLLIDRVVVPSDMYNYYGINTRQLQEYVSLFKIALHEFGFYNIEVVYKRSIKAYVCYINN